MTDDQIVKAFFARDEGALIEARKKYLEQCGAISGNILCDSRDVEECVNEAFLIAWNSIPPEKPKKLGAYLSKLVRNVSLNRYRSLNTQKHRGNGGAYDIGYEMIEDIPSENDVPREYESRRIGYVIDMTLRLIGKSDRIVFVSRYFHQQTYPDISKATGLSEAQIKRSLARTKKKLAEMLQKEGIDF